MCIVQPGSATVSSNGSSSSTATTLAARCSPTTGRVTRTGTSTDPSPGSVSTDTGVSTPSPTTRTCVGSVHVAYVTRTTCSGASAGPTNSCVASAEVSCTGMSALYVRE